MRNDRKSIALVALALFCLALCSGCISKFAARGAGGDLVWWDDTSRSRLSDAEAKKQFEEDAELREEMAASPDSGKADQPGWKFWRRRRAEAKEVGDEEPHTPMPEEVEAKPSPRWMFWRR